MSPLICGLQVKPPNTHARTHAHRLDYHQAAAEYPQSRFAPSTSSSRAWLLMNPNEFVKSLMKMKNGPIIIQQITCRLEIKLDKH